MIRFAAPETVNLARFSCRTPYYMTLMLKRGERVDLADVVRSVTRKSIRPVDLLAQGEVPEVGKYDQFVPPRLLRMAFAEDHLDTGEAASAVAKWPDRPG